MSAPAPFSASTRPLIPQVAQPSWQQFDRQQSNGRMRSGSPRPIPQRLSQPLAFDYDRLHDAISIVRNKQIFFIGGIPKSGTTWLQLLLNGHPEVSAAGEGHFMDLLAPALRMAVGAHEKQITGTNNSIFNELKGYPRLAESEILYLVASTIAMFLVEQSRHKAVRAVGEKTPDNVLMFPKLHTLFPMAKFIQIIRDGRDCAVSAWFHNLRIRPHEVMNDSLERFASGFASDWASGLATAQDFADKNPDSIRQIRYEELASDTATVLAGLFDFLGVSTSNAVLDHCVAEASFETLSKGRSAGEENRLSFFRKGVPGDWRNHLSADTDARFLKQAGTWLHRFGYLQ